MAKVIFVPNKNLTGFNLCDTYTAKDGTLMKWPDTTRQRVRGEFQDVPITPNWNNRAQWILDDSNPIDKKKIEFLKNSPQCADSPFFKGMPTDAAWFKISDPEGDARKRLVKKSMIRKANEEVVAKIGSIDDKGRLSIKDKELLQMVAFIAKPGDVNNKSAEELPEYQAYESILSYMEHDPEGVLMAMDAADSKVMYFKAQLVHYGVISKPSGFWKFRGLDGSTGDLGNDVTLNARLRGTQEKDIQVQKVLQDLLSLAMEKDKELQPA